MAQLTLLEIVQGILDETDGDEVNSITDTTESMQVASIVRQVFYDIVEEMDIPALVTLGALEGLGDTLRPNIMQIPENYNKILWIKYDVRQATGDNKNYRNVDYKSPLDFVGYVNQRPSTDTDNYQVVLWSVNTPLVIRKLQGPQFWTSFDDGLIVFDGYNSNVDTTLQASKSLVQASQSPTLTLDDDSVPQLPDSYSRLLYTQSLARCFANLKTTLNPKHERNENRLRVRSQRNKWRAGRMLHERPHYGRK